MSSRDRLRKAFADYFAAWNIQLPGDRDAGDIEASGWLIQYAFGSDAIGEYLDFYAAHRMTNDRHERLRPDGSCEGLPALCTMMFLPANERERPAAERDFQERNRRIAEELAAKGFTRFTSA